MTVNFWPVTQTIGLAILRRFMALPSDPVFIGGTRGDGTGDDSTAINLALTTSYSPALYSPQSIIYLGPGTYQLLHPIVLGNGPFPNAIRFVGAGQGVTTLIAGAAMAQMVTFGHGQKMEFARMTLNGNGLATTGLVTAGTDFENHVHDLHITNTVTNGMQIQDEVIQLTVERVNCSGMPVGFLIGDVGMFDIQQVTLRSCYAQGCTAIGYKIANAQEVVLEACKALSGVIGLQISNGCSNISVRHMHFEANSNLDLFTQKAAINANQYSVTNLLVEGSHFFGAGGGLSNAAMELQGVNGAVIRNNISDSHTNAGGAIQCVDAGISVIFNRGIKMYDNQIQDTVPYGELSGVTVLDDPVARGGALTPGRKVFGGYGIDTAHVLNGAHSEHVFGGQPIANNVNLVSFGTTQTGHKFISGSAVIRIIYAERDIVNTLAADQNLSVTWFTYNDNGANSDVAVLYQEINQVNQLLVSNNPGNGGFSVAVHTIGGAQVLVGAGNLVAVDMWTENDTSWLQLGVIPYA